MSTYIQANHSARHPGIAPADQTVEHLFASCTLLFKPINSIAAAIRATWARWAQARRQAEADAQLWNLALTDARVMADISRAMSAEAMRDVRAYY